MKNLIFVILFSIASIGHSAGRIEKTALLLLPSQIHAHSVFEASVEFRWDEDEVLVLDIWSIRGESVYGDVRVYDEHGNEVPLLYPMSMPITPDRQRKVSKGELVRVGLYRLGDLQLDKPGLYRAVAEFSSGFVGKTNVHFTTKSKWFTVKP
jgi:hypothetical protein